MSWSWHCWTCCYGVGNQQCRCELCNRSHFCVRDPYGTGCRAWRTPECICFFSVVLGETTKLLHGVHWGSDTRNNSRDCSPTVNKFVQNDIIKCVCVCALVHHLHASYTYVHVVIHGMYISLHFTRINV